MIEPRRFPLSTPQLRVWIAQQSGGAATPAYHVPLCWRVTGALAPAAVAAALAALAARHSVLRTRFDLSGDEPAQLVEPAPRVQFEWAELPADDDGAARLAAATDAPFDLSGRPPWRALLLRVGPESHLLLLVAHHLLLDGSSAAVIEQDLFGGLTRDAAIPAGPPTYGQWSAWERTELARHLEPGLDWWASRLTGTPPVIPLPYDGVRPTAVAATGATLRRELGPEVAAAVRALARNRSTTEFVVGLSLCELWLSRWTGADRFAVGVPAANRDTAPDGLVGLFVNLLACPASVHPADSFLDLLDRVHEQHVGALDHQAVPFEAVVTRLAPPRSAGLNPLVQVLVEVSRAPGIRTRGRMEVDDHPVDVRRTRFDLECRLIAHPGGLRLETTYAEAGFDQASMAGALDLAAALATVVTDPAAPLRMRSSVSAADRERLLAWGRGPASRPRSLLDALARHGADRPAEVAVTAADGELTWAELRDRVAGTAAALRRRLGDTRSAVVAVDPIGSDRAVLPLACLTAGYPFLPVDPSLPPRRLAWQLADAGARLLVTRQEPAGLPVPTLHPDRLRDGPASWDLPGPAAPAYLIYTSGSTGRPKAVVITRDNLAHFADAMGQLFPVEPGEAVLALSAPVFDASVMELAVAIIHGGRYVVLDTGAESPASTAAAALTAGGVAWAGFPPAVLAELSSAGVPPGTTVWVGGDTLAVTDAVRWSEAVRLVNAYGPTEATVLASTHRCGPGETGRVPIGVPAPGSSVYVVDEALRLVPVGVPGEIVLGGPRIAAGYWGRPELTAERFVPDPFSPVLGARMYRTGDRGRWRPDGRLDFLGRRDRQVQLRGLRVEPGEIEAVLRGHPLVTEAAVVATGAGTGTRLVAIVAAGAAAGRTGLTAELIGWCRDRLPRRMVPAGLTVVAALPTLPSGKVDRAAVTVGAAGPRTELLTSIGRRPSSASPQSLPACSARPRWAGLTTSSTSAVTACWSASCSADCGGSRHRAGLPRVR